MFVDELAPQLQYGGKDGLFRLSELPLGIDPVRFSILHLGKGLGLSFPQMDYRSCSGVIECHLSETSLESMELERT